jgi:hypothetical protein
MQLINLTVGMLNNLICCLLNDVVSNLEYTVSNDCMIVNWKACGRKYFIRSLRYHPCICPEGLCKTTKTCQDSRCSGPESDWTYNGV